MNRLLAIGLSLYLLNLTVPYPVMAQEQGQSQRPIVRSLSVTGRGEETIPATIALVQLGVEVQGKNATTVQQEVARRSSAVVELLRSRNVEKLQTTGIRLNPNYSYENNVQRLTGYTGVNTVSFRIDTQRVGNLLDEAVNAGATRIDVAIEHGGKQLGLVAEVPVHGAARHAGHLGDLLQRRGGLLHRRRLLAGRLRQALRGGADLAGRAGHRQPAL